MQTQIGNTTKTFGREYNISVTNIDGEKLLRTYDLRENTLMISSKVDNNLLDIGSYSIFMTDSEGQPVRLTYTIQPGSGLYPNPSDTDVLRMVIDEDSILADDGDELYVNKHNIIDNYTLTVNQDPENSTNKRGNIAVVTANLEKASENRWGIVKADENTTYIPWEYYKEVEGGEIINTTSDDPDGYAVESGIICVNTENLDRVDDETNTNGIVQHSSEMFRTIAAKNGKLSVLTYNLDKATSTQYGVIKTDDITIQADDNGVVNVITSGLDHSTKDSYGISKGDEKTIKANNGVLSVYTPNLSFANYTTPGVVIVDSYSMSIIDGKLSVNRYSDINKVLNDYDSTINGIKEDISILNNRVLALETIASQERIEFLTAIGDVETVLPEPIFDRETWTVDNYSTRKTISFSIRTNCKFNVNVEYKAGTNDYNQVTLLSVTYGDDAAIPANQLANTQFDATGNTVKTLYFNFSVKNYDKDDDISSTNTHVKVSAASINDASIKQTSFHIFKCWNNIAFTEDEPEEPVIEEEIIEPQSYIVVLPGTEKISTYGNIGKDSLISYNKTSSSNFYFKTSVNATYTYYDNTSNSWETIPKILDQSSEIGDGKYDIKVRYQEIDDAGKPGNLVSSLDWLNTSITASYNTTKQFNVLTVNSTSPINTRNRSAYIICYLSNSFVEVSNENNGKEMLFEKDLTTEVIEEKNIELSDKAKNIRELPELSDTSNFTIDLTTTEGINKFNDIVSHNDNINNISDSSVKTIVKAISLKKDSVSDAKETHTSLVKAKKDTPVLSDILFDDINEYKTIKKELSYFQEKPKIYNKEKYITYTQLENKLNKYATKIANEYNKFIDITKENKERLTINTNSYITFKYSETMDLVQPVVTVTANVGYSGGAYSGGGGINFTITRNTGSLVKSTNYNVTCKYSFVNKNGDLVDSNGYNNKNSSYEISFKPSEKLTYSYLFNSNIINGTRTESQDVYTYYNLFLIDYDTIDRASLWGIGNGNKDAGVIYWAGAKKTGEGTSTNITSISDNIYAVFKLTGQDAKINRSQKYSYYAINLKSFRSGNSQDFEQADDIEFVGLSKNNYWKSKSCSVQNSIKMGDNIYVIGNVNKVPTSIIDKDRLTSSVNSAISTYGGVSKIKTAEDKTNVFKLATKNYYNWMSNPNNNVNEKYKLIYNHNTIPVKVANNIVGIKILNVTISSDAFWIEPQINWTTSGSWKSTNDGNNSNNNVNYTFGNAKISSITIKQWDDFSMELGFVIQGGSTTNIPNGTNIIETKSSANGKTNFIFLQNSKSYEYTQFYNNYSFSATTWNNNSCSVKYKLYNKSSATRTIAMDASQLYYSKDTRKLETIYTDETIKYALKNNSRNYTRNLSPYLENITGIKFWIGINCSGITVKKRFESSLSSIGNQVLINATFNGIASKQISIVNALDNNTAKSSSSTTRTSYM